MIFSREAPYELTNIPFSKPIMTVSRITKLSESEITLIPLPSDEDSIYKPIISAYSELET